MKLYAAIDLHSNNSYLVILSEEGKQLYAKRLPNDLAIILQELSPYQNDIEGIAVESTYNWYWLVDGLMTAGYKAHLVNTVAVQQYSGIKHTDDKSDAQWLANLLKLGILPEGYIYPKEQRSTRDFFRKRMWLVQKRTMLILSLQCMVTRGTSIRLAGSAIQKLTEVDLARFFINSMDYQSASVQLSLLHHFTEQINFIEKATRQELKKDANSHLLESIPGVGPILSTTILLETGPIERFDAVGNYASYCRCVGSNRVSNGKSNGKNNSKNGNAYLSWAFIEAANNAIRYDTVIKKYYHKKAAKTHRVVALKAIAHKLARATYYMLKEQVPFNRERAFMV